MGEDPRGISSLKALVYGAGTLMGVGSSMIVSWLMYYYCPPPEAGLIALAPVFAMGVVILFGRFIDAISDPIIGWWSDRTITRWGRRRPFIFFGFLAMLFSQILIWIPLVHRVSLINVLYAAVMDGIFWFGYTAAINPYLALIPEIAKNPDDRVKLTTFQAFFSQISLVIGGVIVPLLLAAIGFISTAVVLGGIGFAVMVPLLIVIKEKPPEEKKIATGMGMYRALLLTFKNRIFLLYLIPTAVLFLSATMIQMEIPYAVNVLAGLNKKEVSLFYLPLIITAIISLPFYKKFASKYGKKKLYLMAMTCFMIPAFLTAFIGIIPVNPRTMIIGLGALAGIFVAPLYIFPNAIIADITDIDERMTGYRREAIYFGSQGLITKTMAGLAGVLTGTLMWKLGYSPGNDLGIRASFILAALVLIIAALIFRKYPIEK